MTLSPHRLLKYVPCNVTRRLVAKLAKRREPVSPDLIQGLTVEQRAQFVALYQLFVLEAEIKKVRVVMRTIVLIAILAASVIGEFWHVMPKFLPELFKVFFVE